MIGSYSRRSDEGKSSIHPWNERLSHANVIADATDDRGEGFQALPRVRARSVSAFVLGRVLCERTNIGEALDYRKAKTAKK